MDALVSERLTRYDGIVNIYGHCGLALLSELLDYGNLEDTAILGSGYIQQQDLQDKEELKPQNELTPTSKLDLALEIAELIAILHEYPDGIIVHDDVQPSQFLFDKNGHLKLNDFNRAEILLWDDQAKKYCKYRNGQGNGNFRAPEEYFDKPLDEMIDVYSFGNNIYVLLTGLWPFYNYSDDRVEEVQEMIRNGETPFLDLRYGNESLAEAFLIEIMVDCWSYHPEDRPDMISIVRQLKAAKQDVKRQSSRQDDLRRR
jgi:serine/threonine protein kinase